MIRDGLTEAGWRFERPDLKCRNYQIGCHKAMDAADFDMDKTDRDDRLLP